jgi:dethiobiotin synthetase
MPAGAGGVDAATFLTMASSGLAPAYGGRFDAADFRRTHDPTPKGTP